MESSPCGSMPIGHYANAIVDTVREPILILDAGLCVKSANPAFYRTFGASEEETRGKRIFELGDGQWDIPALRQLLESLLRQDGRFDNFDVEHDFPKIGHKVMRLNARRLARRAGYVELILLAIEDITELKQAEDMLFAEKELAQLTLRAIADAVITTDAAGCVKYLNPAAERLTGWRNGETHGLPLDKVFNIVDETSREPMSLSLVDLLTACPFPATSSSILLLSRGGREYRIEDSSAPILGRDGTLNGLVLVFRDVTQKEALIKKISYQAEHDGLTGLINRPGFESTLQDLLDDPHLRDKHHALLYLDLDQFKIVNDTCGHHAGDQLLRQLAALLQTKMRQADTFARLGGDEFAVLLFGCQLEEANRIGKFLVDTVRNFRFVWESCPFTVSVSIGLVVIDEADSVDSVLNAADAACYAAKNKGRNRVEQYVPRDASQLRARSEIDWVARIEEAFRKNRFLLYYQRIKPLLSTPQSEYCEVLLRMVDKKGHIIPPMAFIPTAERSHLMPKIDRWVIATLFNMVAAHHKNDEAPEADWVHYGVNLSAQSIGDPQFLEFIREQFDRTGIPAASIYFEIKEAVALADWTRASPFTQALQDLGCSFVLDDFGNGLSSFAALKHLPISYLKINRGFIGDIAHSRVDLAMVEAIQHVSAEMKILTIAEFVESEETMSELRRIGIDFAQGYSIHRPERLAFS